MHMTRLHPALQRAGSLCTFVHTHHTRHNDAGINHTWSSIAGRARPGTSAVGTSLTCQTALVAQTNKPCHTGCPLSCCLSGQPPSGMLPQSCPHIAAACCIVSGTYIHTHLFPVPLCGTAGSCLAASAWFGHAAVQHSAHYC